ncbi:MAG: hypothetical protein ACSHYA_02495 [Opitutaceae bacterium]
MRLPLWTTTLVAILTLAIGFGIGRSSISPKSTPEQATQKPSARSPEQAQSAAPVSTSDSEHYQTITSASSSLLSHLTLNELEQRARQQASLPQGRQNPALLSLLISEWAQQDPYTVLAFAQEHERPDWLHESLTVLGRDNPDDALQWIEGNITSLGLQGHLTSAVYRGLAQEDPVAAITRIEQGTVGAQRDQLLYSTVSEWAQQDIDSVFDWIEIQEDSPFLFSIYSQVMGSYIEQAPQDAITLVSAMEENPDKSNFANRAAYNLAIENPQAALTWAETLQGEAKHFALMGLIEHWGASGDGAEALNYAKNQPQSERNDELLSMALMKLAHSNPEALAQEMPTLSESQQSLAAVQLAQVYSAHSPEKTTEWLNTLEEGSIRDTALKISLNSFRGSNISQAFSLAETISDDALRQSEIKQTLSTWIPVDPAAASEALDKSTAIPESTKKLLRQYLASEAPTVADYLLPARAN